MLPTLTPSPGSPGPTPRPKVWTVAEFHTFGDLGVFEGRRASLIDGVILEEGPMNPPHRLALELTAEAVRAAFGPGWRVCVRMPLLLGRTTDPEPDVAVVAGSVRGATGHPTTAALAAEVSDTSLRYDTADKMSLYAAAGIADYWVLDVVSGRLLVHRTPAPDAAHRFGHAYASVATLTAADAVAPLAVPAASVRIADLLP